VGGEGRGGGGMGEGVRGGMWGGVERLGGRGVDVGLGNGYGDGGEGGGKCSGGWEDNYGLGLQKKRRIGKFLRRKGEFDHTVTSTYA